MDEAMPGEPQPNLDTGFVPSFRPDDAMWDAPDHEVPVPVDSRAMGEWDLEHKERIDELNPDESFLSREEEQELAQEVQAGLAAAKRLLSLESNDPLYAELLKIAADGQAARDELVVTNLRLAAWLVRESMDFNKGRRLREGGDPVRGKIVANLASLSGGSLDYGDRMQVATIGLIKAAEKFAGQTTFTQFALYQMEADLIKAIGRQEVPLVLPHDKSQSINRLRRSREILAQEGNLEPSYAELSRYSGMYPGEVEATDRLTHQFQHISFEMLAEILPKLRAQHESTDDEDAEELSIADRIVDEYRKSPSMEEQAALVEVAGRIEDLLDGLNELEQLIISLRFGLQGDEPMTLEEVGKELGLTRERIRQTEKKVLTKLRQPSRSAALQGYFSEPAEDAEHGLRPAVTLTDAEEMALGSQKYRSPEPKAYAKTEMQKDKERQAQIAHLRRAYSLEEYRRLQERE